MLMAVFDTYLYHDSRPAVATETRAIANRHDVDCGKYEYQSKRHVGTRRAGAARMSFHSNSGEIASGPAEKKPLLHAWIDVRNTPDMDCGDERC